MSTEKEVSLPPFDIDYYIQENKEIPPEHKAYFDQEYGNDSESAGYSQYPKPNQLVLPRHESEDWEGPPESPTQWRNPSPPPNPRKRSANSSSHHSGQSFSSGPVPPKKKRSSAPTTKSKNADLMCPFHHKRIMIQQSKKGNPYATCMFYGRSCPFICFGPPALVRKYCEVDLSSDVQAGPWDCFCDKPSKMRQCQNPESDNFNKFFIGCAEPASSRCNFFQWCHENWGEIIRQFRSDSEVKAEQT